MGCPDDMGSCCLISEEEVSAAINGFKIGKSVGAPGVVSEIMEASYGLGTGWMTDRMNNIIKEYCIPDDWGTSTLVAVYKDNGDTELLGDWSS